jgi:hypothetical protein
MDFTLLSQYSYYSSRNKTLQPLIDGRRDGPFGLPGAGADYFVRGRTDTPADTCASTGRKSGGIRHRARPLCSTISRR